MSSAGASDLLVWIDLEMTGLDVEHDVIVEIACVVTDSALDLRDDGIDIVVHQSPAVLDRMDDYVRAMHTKSGLIGAIEASTIDLDSAGARVLEYIQAHVPESGRAPLCGNSIGTDRRFLAKYLRAIEDHLHYRSIDVSSIKELTRRWYPDEYRARPAKNESHRALDDILESVAELRYYRDHVFKQAAPPPA